MWGYVINLKSNTFTFTRFMTTTFGRVLISGRRFSPSLPPTSFHFSGKRFLNRLGYFCVSSVSRCCKHVWPETVVLHGCTDKCGIVFFSHYKYYILTATMEIATKHDKVVTCHKGLPSIKSDNTLNTLSHKTIW